MQLFLMDIDDTLTTHGQITAPAFQSMWDLHRAGIRVIPITGRPAGWCDHIARMWPVEAVIGENGAFYYRYDRINHRMQRHSFQNESDRLEGINRLEIMRNRVLNDVPGCAISADQSFRVSDLAIDFCEDVEPLDSDAVEAICSIGHELGLTCKISSIHVNCWFGEFNKLNSLKNYLQNNFSQTLDELQDQICFIGDSPNDEPVFSVVRQSVAVSNIATFLDRLNHRPAYMTHHASGAGFNEAVQVILGKRNAEL